jgi:hypothetical protein
VQLVLQLLAYTMFSAVLQIVCIYGICFKLRTYVNTLFRKSGSILLPSTNTFTVRHKYLYNPHSPFDTPYINVQRIKMTVNYWNDTNSVQLLLNDVTNRNDLKRNRKLVSQPDRTSSPGIRIHLAWDGAQS